jgi:hypothetical protein
LVERNFTFLDAAPEGPNITTGDERVMIIVMNDRNCSIELPGVKESDNNRRRQEFPKPVINQYQLLL